jgi:RHS repeat-associated protein
MLDYSSGMGNGPFGLGWGLGLGAITRRTDKGLPRYDDAVDSDIFILAGAEDLVPQPGSPTEVVDSDGVSHAVRRYHPRTEAGFARIERWTSKENPGDVFWRVTSRDNITSVFGRDDQSRIFQVADDGGGPAAKRIFSWLLSEVYDQFGNCAVYVYKAENEQNINTTAVNEVNRTSTTRGVQRYIKSIRYGNRKPNRDLGTWEVSSKPLSSLEADAWTFEIVFDYGEHSDLDPNPEDAGLWGVRRDPFSSFRSTFEIRTYRLCRRVLLFHRFPDELGVAALLVAAVELTYEEKPTISFLTSVMSRGYLLRGADKTLPPGPGPYFSRATPPITLEYSAPANDEQMSNLVVQEVDDESMESLPMGVTSPYQWLDLYGEGLQGIFTNQGGSWFYKRNLSAVNAETSLADGTIRSTASFGPLERVDEMPNLSLAEQLQFMDLAGDGALDIALLGGRQRCYYEADREAANEGQWQEVRSFQSWPADVDFSNPNLRLVDLTGDGLADIVISEDAVFTFYPSLGTDGFGEPSRISQWTDEERSPRILFANHDEAVYFADMTGDGTSDICRVRNGNICYWPNLGYGRFGGRITMHNSPVFDRDDAFNKSRLILCDMDGSGSTDLVYVGVNAVTLYCNEAGNGWAIPRVLPTFLPPIDSLSDISAVDILGNGTSCLVWSSSAPGQPRSTIRYIDFNRGVKPHLLIRIDNNIGKETRMTYLPSTTYYLRDRANGTPWATRLATPVQCLERVQEYDAISRSFSSSRYAYHHGYFDPTDREFRGFGMVEQWDTEEFDFLDARSPSDVANVEMSSYMPPVLTKRWYHTGAFVDGDKLQRQYAREYFGASSSPQTFEEYYAKNIIKDSIEGELSLTGAEAREASRSLKTMLLREEIYALDGTEASTLPYAITDTGHNVRILQRPNEGGHGVCFTYQREEVKYFSERTPEDSRIQHGLTLAVDSYGNITKSIQACYGRSAGKSNLTSPMKELQEKTLIEYVETGFSNAVDEGTNYRAPVQSWSATYEITGVRPQEDESRFHVEDFAGDNFAPIETMSEIPNEAVPSLESPQRRLLARSSTMYRKDDLSGSCPVGTIESMAIPFMSYNLCLTPGILDVLNRKGVDIRPPREDLSSHYGYVDLHLDDNWWMPSGRGFFAVTETAEMELQSARSHFYVPVHFKDVFNQPTDIIYDNHFLSVTSVTNAVGNTVSYEYDYRTLKPRMIIDENRNRTAYAYDSYGLLVLTAVMGKADDAEPHGDSLDSVPTELSDESLDKFFLEPLDHREKLLGTASTRFIHDLNRFRTSSNSSPAVTAELLRDSHMHDEAPTNIQISLTYSDGHGREVQVKKLIESEAASPLVPRWIGSSWKIFNNKDLVVRQYKPFFATTHNFQSNFRAGVSPIFIYDALGRLVVVIHPDKSWSKTVNESWRSISYDSNDTVLQNPKTDPAFKQYLYHIPDADLLPTWYEQRQDGQMGVEAQLAAQKTVPHDSTPTVTDYNALGQTFTTTVNNGDGEIFTSFMVLDITGAVREIHDQRGRTIDQSIYDLAGQKIHCATMDAGERWFFHNAVGDQVLLWDSRGQRWRQEYDEIGRHSNEYLQIVDGGTEMLYEKLIYGESRPGAETNNLRGELYQHYDQAGIETYAGFDFEGNLVSRTRQLAVDYITTLDWSNSASVTLEPETHLMTNTYDALHRTTSMQTPDQSVIKYAYNDSNLVNHIEVNMKGERDSSGNLIWTTYVSNVEYDELSMPVVISLGNGCRTENTYDPLTDRLSTTKTWSGIGSNHTVYQNLAYTYDAVGNITTVKDDAQQTIYFRNNVVTAGKEYTYDACYRLKEAKGREHVGQTNGQPSSPTAPRPFGGLGVSIDQAADGNAMARYIESYLYDSTNNILSLDHYTDDSRHQGWSRKYQYDQGNRLSSTTVGSLIDKYAYDGPGGEHGCMTSMPHLSSMLWGPRDELRATSRQVVKNGGTPETTWYVYGNDGIRIRKVTVRQEDSERVGQAPRKLKERIYLGGFEIYRKYAPDGVTTMLQSETLHVEGDHIEVDIVEDWTSGEHPGRLIRYQVDDHLDAVTVEIDDTGRLVSYEEYSPYGDTTYQMVLSEKPKRFRWTSKERDNENGLYYNEARYYAPWLGRWTAADPIGHEGGLNLHAYVDCNPAMHIDASGLNKGKSKKQQQQQQPNNKKKSKSKGVNKKRKKKRKKKVDKNWTHPEPDVGVQDPVRLARGRQALAERLEETLVSHHLHHVFPDKWEPVWTHLEFDHDKYTIVLDPAVHNVLEAGDEDKKLPAWQQRWKDKFFEKLWGVTKKQDIFTAVKKVKTASAKEELRGKAFKVMKNLMTDYGISLTRDNPLYEYDKNEDPGPVSIFTPYKLVHLSGADKNLKSFIRGLWAVPLPHLKTVPDFFSGKRALFDKLFADAKPVLQSYGLIK